ncbi:uncharacterized protein LOC108913041 isoform X2 [Anoplophora glabripennis]|nr:uncharacterized protein LOC108913041 isoform X2 [Anoplophora glabripennis]XP_018574020.1 uncharacterized protein LOC108913041 isoform X2 [Anoplophora glabripennis]XP_018574021.1 uncharacterized protein LOC108913041 isoform X2 [Anoplophora glabripennis]
MKITSTSTNAVKAKPFFMTNFAKSSPMTAVSDNRSVSFDDIPGPHSLRLISKFWGTIPIMGAEVTVSIIQYLLSGGKFFGGILSWGGNKHFFKKFFDVYGPVVRLHGPFGSDVVLLNRPEHANAVFQNEGPYPIRCCLDSVEKYRLEYRRFRQAGPFLMLKMGKPASKFMRVCSLHFKASDYCARYLGVTGGYLKRYLKKNAVPSQNLPKNSVIEGTKSRTRTLRTKPIVHCEKLELLEHHVVEDAVPNEDEEISQGTKYSVDEITTAQSLLLLCDKQVADMCSSEYHYS